MNSSIEDLQAQIEQLRTAAERRADALAKQNEEDKRGGICTPAEALEALSTYETRLKEMNRILSGLAEQATTRKGRTLYAAMQKIYTREVQQMRQRVPFLMASFRAAYLPYLSEGNSLPERD